MKVYPELDDQLTKFILSQPVFFVATAPCLSASGKGGHVNLSPKHNTASIDGLPALG